MTLQQFLYQRSGKHKMKAVIFDLDGVLVSTDELHYLAWDRLANDLGITGFTKKDNERQRGVSRMESLEVVLEKSDKKYNDEEKLELAERKNDYFKESLKTLTPDDLLPGSKETLLLLRERDIKTAVGSASKNALEILDRIGIMPLLDEISSGLDVTKSKPDPEVFLVAAKKLNLPPEECLVVEDAAAGIEAANRGGFPSLAVGPLFEEIGGTFQARDLSCVEDWNIILNH